MLRTPAVLTRSEKERSVRASIHRLPVQLAPGFTPEPPRPWIDAAREERIEVKPAVAALFIVLDRPTRDGVEKITEGWPGINFTVTVRHVESVKGYQWVMIDSRMPNDTEQARAFERDAQSEEPRIKILLIETQDVGRLVDATRDFVDDINQALMGECDAPTHDPATPQPPEVA